MKVAQTKKALAIMKSVQDDLLKLANILDHAEASGNLSDKDKEIADLVVKANSSVGDISKILVDELTP